MFCAECRADSGPAQKNSALAGRPRCPGTDADRHPGLTRQRRRDALVLSGLVIAANLVPLLAVSGRAAWPEASMPPRARTGAAARWPHAARGVARPDRLRGGRGAAAATADNASVGYGGLEEASLRKGAAAGDLAAIAKALKDGANVLCLDMWRQAPLHHAAQQGHAEAVHLLLQAGADVDAKDYLGRTPLVLAAMCGCSDAVSLLLGSGADLTHASISPWPNNNGRTALHWACYYGHASAAALLCSHVADTGGKEAAGGSQEEPGNAQSGSWVLEIKDAMRRSALHWAARRGHAACVEVLLYYGAKTEDKDKKDASPLKLAETHKHRDCAALLQRVHTEQGRPRHLPPAVAPTGRLTLAQSFRLEGSTLPHGKQGQVLFLGKNRKPADKNETYLACKG